MSSKWAIYLRVSTLDQAKGIESQERAIREYLAGHGITDAVWYRDVLSAEDLRRPAFERLQRDVFNGKVKTIVVWKLDRISRTMRDGINVLHDWLDKDIRVVAIQQMFDFGGVTGKLIAAVLFAIAEFERESLRENTKRGIANAKAKGVEFKGRRPTLFAKDIVPLIQQGKSVSEVAEHLGHSRPAVYAALKREGVEIAKVRNGVQHDHQEVRA